MNKPKIAVVDDELNDRKESYDRFLSEKFSVNYFGDESNLVNAFNKDVKMIIIDKILAGWSRSMEEILDDVSSTNRDIPIIIVSKHWNDDHGKPISNMLNLKMKYNVLQFFSWDEIANTLSDSVQFDLVIKNWKNRINYEFDLYQQRYPSLPDANSAIQLLQIADMQFGAASDPGTLGDRFAISSYLKNSMWLPNFVAICGDIAQSGKKKEFHEAKKWIDDFSKTLWSNNDESKKFLVTVGNHDCNFDAFLQYYYCSVFPDEKKSISEFNFQKRTSQIGKEIWNNPENKISVEEVVFSNYIKFANDLSCNYRSIHQTDHLNIVNDFFLNWGIRIIHLNSLNDISPENLNGIGINENDMDHIIDYCTNCKNEPDIFTIIISHYGPHELGYKSGDNEEQTQWVKIKKFLSQVKVNLWLCGHKHNFEIDKINMGKMGFSDPKKDIPYATTGSLRLDRSSLAPGAYIGFNKIELLRKDGVINKIIVTPVAIIDDTPEPQDSIDFDVKI